MSNPYNFIVRATAAGLSLFALIGCQSAAPTARPAPPAAGVPSLASPTTSPALADEMVVARQELEFAAATVRQDNSVYVRLMSDDFRGVNALGTTHDKAHDVDSIPKPNYKVLTYNVTDMTVKSLGGDGILVTSIVHQAWSVNPTKWDGDYAVTNVWRREAGQWRLFRSHWTKIERDYKH